MTQPAPSLFSFRMHLPFFSTFFTVDIFSRRTLMHALPRVITADMLSVDNTTTRISLSAANGVVRERRLFFACF